MKSIERSIDRGNSTRSAEPHFKSLHSFAEEYNQTERPKFELKKPMLEIVPINSEEEEGDS